MKSKSKTLVIMCFYSDSLTDLPFSVLGIYSLDLPRLYSKVKEGYEGWG